MVGLPFDTGTTQPAVRKPGFSVTAPAPVSGGLGAVAGAVGDLLGVGGQDPWARSVEAITVQAGIAPQVDRVEIVLGTGGQAPAVALGDELAVSLGYGDSDLSPVMTGRVTAINQDLRGRQCIVLTNGAHQLARGRLNQSYEEQSAGDIVNQLLSEFDIPPGNVESGHNYPFYVVDDRRSLWRHIADLALQNGFCARINAAGELDFSPLNDGDVAAEFHYGIDILSIDLHEHGPVFDGVAVTGAGAAGSQGPDAAFWVVSDSDGISSSQGNGTPIRAIPALRDAAAVEVAGAAIVTQRHRLAKAGRLRVPGVAVVEVGQAIGIAGTPGGRFDGTWLVMEVRHRLDKRNGFISEFAVSQSGNGGLSGVFPGGLL